MVREQNCHCMKMCAQTIFYGLMFLFGSFVFLEKQIIAGKDIVWSVIFCQNITSKNLRRLQPPPTAEICVKYLSHSAADSLLYLKGFV